jgi:predicted nuclease with TOPRIM domain
MISRRIVLMSFSAFGLCLVPAASGQGTGTVPSANHGYEQTAKSAEAELNKQFLVLDGMAKRNEICKNLTDYQLRLDAAKRQADVVRDAWKVYFKEVSRTREILIKTANKSIDDFERERAVMEGDRQRLVTALADLQRRANELPPDTPADRRMALQDLISGTQKQLRGYDALMADLVKDYDIKKILAGMDSLLLIANTLNGASMDLYQGANKMLIAGRYEDRMGKCLGAPQGQ